jgi:hypothetical protein
MSTPDNQHKPHRPLVITDITLPGLLEYALSLPGQKHLIICTSRLDFLQKLYAAIDINDPLLTPTLSQLSTSSTVSTAFCATLQTLLAYLSTIPFEQSIPKPNTIILIYPLSLHNESATHSAQSLSRTFASVVDASIRSIAHLIIAEPLPDLDEEEDATMDQEPQDPWDAHMPILNNTSTRNRLEQRGWVGRTVTGRTLAQRWCIFRSLAELSHRDEL